MQALSRAPVVFLPARTGSAPAVAAPSSQP
jgi:hypothetical protein